MNKRILLFASLVGLSFVTCQIVFGFKDYRSYKKDIVQQVELSNQALLSANIVGLNVAPWSKNENDDFKKNQHAVMLGGSMLVLSKDPIIEENLFCDSKKWEYVAKTSVCHGINVLLYRDNLSNFKQNNVGKLFLPSSKEGLPVLIVEFRNNKDPLVLNGVYKNGKVIGNHSKVYGTSLIFWRSGNEYMPLGLYDTKEEKLFGLEIPITRAVFVDNEQSNDSRHAYYVLENEYLQMVVSKYSGSVVSINLPFVSNSSESIVNEIGVDRQIEKTAPQEATFPGFNAEDYKKTSIPSKVGGYYPFLRRGLLSKEDMSIKPVFHAFNIVSGRDLDNILSTDYNLIMFNSRSIVLESKDGAIRKEFVLPESPGREPYSFNVIIDLKEDRNDLWINSGVPEVEILSNAFIPGIRYRSSKNGRNDVLKLKLPSLKDSLSIKSSIYPDWILNSNGYFGVIMTPLGNMASKCATEYIPGQKVPTRLSVVDPLNKPYPVNKYPGYQTLLSIPNSKGRHEFRVYTGPLSETPLKVLDHTFTDQKEGSPGYLGCLVFRGMFAFISEPFARLLFIIMKFFYFVTQSWGISIILLTMFLKLLLYPLNTWSIKSMRRMQVLSPQIQSLQQKYKNEPKRAQMEIMTLYKTNKVNPVTGCLPMIIQLPFLIAMFDLLKSSFLLRGASFIPGWIDNLTAPDVVFSWKTSIFFIGNELHLLPIILGLVMFIQQKMTSAASKNQVLSDQQRQQQAMGSVMALMFTAMFYNFPSGLNIYWLSSMLLGIIQQWGTNKFLDYKSLNK